MVSTAAEHNRADGFTYAHRQRGPWWLLMYVLAAVFMTVAWYVQAPAALRITFSGTGFVMFALGAGLHHLTVEDQGHRLRIAFGPLSLFRRHIWYEDIRGFEAGRTTILEGWGIHLSPRGGWVWNIWGFDCVVLRLKRGVLRVGTDDADGLVAFLEARLGMPAGMGNAAETRREDGECPS